VILQFLEFLYPAVLAAVVLSAIHSWLGIQVVERGAVFPALALAQLAALGVGISIRAGVTPYLGALVLTLGGAALFVFHRRDTLVAVVYVISAAGTYLSLGGERLAGDLLSVRVRTIVLTAIVYVAVAAVLFFVRKQWVLFVALAVVLTSSVRIAGVLLVFSYLIAPAVVSRRFAIAWPFSALVGVAGILLAFKLDQPTAPTIVCTLGIAVAIIAAVRALKKRLDSSRGAAESR
jgi:zinc/manganese transport system permease protein